MKYFAFYLFALFVGLPMVMFGAHIATLPEEDRRDLNETVKDLNGRIYKARITCPRSGSDHVMRVHGRSREEARRKVAGQLRNCDVEMLDGASAPIWREAVREAISGKR